MSEHQSPPERPTAAPETPGYTTTPPPGAGGPPIASFGETDLAGRHMLAGWWSRVGAALIDSVIVGVGGLLLLIAITAPFSLGFFAGEDAGWVSIIVGLFLAIICVSIMALLYAPALMARTNGKTLGRMAVGIRVVRANGEPMTFGFAMLREVVGQDAAVRDRQPRSRAAWPASPTCCGRCGTRRTGRSTISSWTRAS